MSKGEIESPTSIKVDETLDTSGLICPEPVMMLHKAVRGVSVDEVIHVIATDPSTERDIPKFCQFLGHELMETLEKEGCYHYWIKKTGA